MSKEQAMTTSTRFISAAASLFATALLTLSATSARAADPVNTPRQAVVRVANLNLNTAQGRQKLDRRLFAAAASVCDRQQRFPSTEELGCRRQAIANAKAQIGSSALPSPAAVGSLQ